MNKNRPVVFALLIVSLVAANLQSKAQSTFSAVHQILQNNCTASGCHNTADAAANLDLTASIPDVYAALVNQAPGNTTAESKGHKLIAPGYVAKSYLYRKIAGGFDPMATVDSSETSAVHDSLPALTNTELETIRQWIHHGASQTDTLVDLQLVHDFQNGLGLPMVDKPLSPEEEGLEGIQLRIGPILMYPGQEVEYFHKFKADLPKQKEIYRMETFFDNYSHHFVIYNFLPSSAASYPEGLQNAGSYSAQIPIHLGAKEIGAWSVSQNNQLPPGTAFFWDETTNVVLDYHVRNYHATQILGATCYINIYTRDRQLVTSEMHMDFPVYGGFNPFQLKIPPTGGQPYKLEFALTKNNQVWDLWKMQGHTHSKGYDFDIFLRNADGSRGRQIYEGFYNSDYTFNQGYFDNEHAPIRTTETPFERVNMTNGLILEATWKNNTPDTIHFGLTTQDEMFAAYLTYTLYKNPTGILTPENEVQVSILPNPASDFVKVEFADIKADRFIRVYSVEGKILFQSQAFTDKSFTLPVLDFPRGLHFIETMEGEKSSVAKVVFE